MATAASAPVNKIERAHQMYREGLYEEALGFYTEALGLAKTKSQKIALHSNRAACFLKLLDFKQAAEECTSVLVLDHDHTGALMLRAQTLVTLKEYNSALFDVNRLTELNPSSEVYRNLQSRLKTQLVLLCLRRNMDSGLKKNKENCVLRKVLQDHINDIELRMFVETGLNHYYKLFQMKEDAAKAVFFYLTHGTWRTLVERLFLWLRGFRPSELLNLPAVIVSAS